MFRRISQIAALALPLVFASVSQAAVWTTTNSWNAQWEQAFAKFVNELPLTYFNNPNSPYGLIETDCADAAYSLRTIFAYENGLPVNFRNYGSKDLSNNNTQYDSVPAGKERLRRFLKLVNLNTDTGTLIYETYPIAINRNSVIPGTMLMHAPKKEMKNGEDWTPGALSSKHVFYVQNISASGLITYISSTVPVKVRNLNARNGYVYSPFNYNSGYRAWKWPNTEGQPLESRLNGSEEQFFLANWQDSVFLNGSTIRQGREAMWKQDKVWSDVVRSRIKGAGRGKEINPSEELAAVIGNVSSAVNDRITVVQEGWNFYQSRYGGRGCMSDGDYDSFSTPSRDTRIQTEFAYLPAAAMRYLKSKGKAPTQSELNRLYANYRFEIVPGKVMTLAQILDTFNNSKTKKALAISEPEHSPEIRWGLSQYTSSAQWPCPHHAKKYLGSEGY